MKKHVLKSLFFAPLMLIGISASAQSSTTIPQFKSEAEKQEWIKQHPVEYAKAQQSTTTSGTGSTMGTTVSQPSGQLVNAEGFPAYVNTGDKTKDDAAYQAAKEAWIAQHPDEYNKMTGNQPK